jgi:hypothetical protein
VEVKGTPPVHKSEEFSGVSLWKVMTGTIPRRQKALCDLHLPKSKTTRKIEDDSRNHQGKIFVGYFALALEQVLSAW